MASVKSYDYFEIDQCPKMGIFRLKSLKIEIAVKLRVMKHFQTIWTQPSDYQGKCIRQLRFQKIWQLDPQGEIVNFPTLSRYFQI